MSTTTVKTLQEVTTIFNTLKQKELLVKNTTYQERKKKLQKFHRTFLSMQKEIQEALYQDLKRNATEANLTEIGVVLSECRYAISKLKCWDET